MNVVRDIKSKAKLLNVLFVLIIYLHCQACVIWFMIVNDKLWNNPVLTLELYWETKFYSDAPYAQYLVSVHFSMLTFLGADTLPLIW